MQVSGLIVEPPKESRTVLDIVKWVLMFETVSLKMDFWFDPKYVAYVSTRYGLNYVQCYFQQQMTILTVASRLVYNVLTWTRWRYPLQICPPSRQYNGTTGYLWLTVDKKAMFSSLSRHFTPLHSTYQCAKGNPLLILKEIHERDGVIVIGVFIHYRCVCLIT